MRPEDTYFFEDTFPAPISTFSLARFSNWVGH